MATKTQQLNQLNPPSVPCNTAEMDQHAERRAAAAAKAAHHPSPADRLTARWNLFRSDHASLYDVLLWRQLEWPSLALQWQPASWQLPQVLQDSQQADADELEAEVLAAADDASADSANKGTDEPSSRSHQASGSKQRVLMPVEYQYLLVGDQTSQAERSHISLWRVRLPGQLPAEFDPHQQQLVLGPGKIEHMFDIPHDMQDVNKLHSMPTQLNIVATCCDEPQIRLYDLNIAGNGGKEDSDSADEEDSTGSLSQLPQSDSQQQGDHHSLVAVLGGRLAGGYGLEWNPRVTGLLLGADNTGGVQLWDVQSTSLSGSECCRQIQPVQAYPDYADCSVNDVSWHSSGNVFAAATEQGELMLQDIRSAARAASAGGSASRAAAAAAGLCKLSPSTARSERVHVMRERRGQGTAAPDCLSVDFDQHHPYRLASGGADGYVCILDMRKLAEPLEQLGLHAGSVTQVSWSKGPAGLLASAGQDGHILLWDSNKMKHALKTQHKPATFQQGARGAAACSGGAGLGLPEPRHTKQREAAAQLALPGLLFAHHGHIGAVDAVAWNPNRPWMLASCSPAATAKDHQGEEVTVQETTLMVWEVNRCMGLLC